MLQPTKHEICGRTDERTRRTNKHNTFVDTVGGESKKKIILVVR